MSLAPDARIEAERFLNRIPKEEITIAYNPNDQRIQTRIQRFGNLRCFLSSGKPPDASLVTQYPYNGTDSALIVAGAKDRSYLLYPLEKRQDGGHDFLQAKIPITLDKSGRITFLVSPIYLRPGDILDKPIGARLLEYTLEEVEARFKAGLIRSYQKWLNSLNNPRHSEIVRSVLVNNP